MQLDKKLIGHEFKAFTTTVEAGKVRLFCKAIGEEDPIYSDEAAAKTAGYRGVAGAADLPAGASPTTIRTRAGCCACSTSISA